ACVVLFILRHAPSPTLFPYTTLFRSRCGLRIDPRGSWERVGVRPDLSAWSKSLANGYPLAALMGAEPFREAAGRITATGSFWLRSEEHTSELQSLRHLVCRLLLEKKK